MKTKCFDIVRVVVQEANMRFGRLYRMNEDRYKILESYCNAIDVLSDTYGGNFFEVEVNEDTLCVDVAVEMPNMIVNGKDSTFHNLANAALTVQFSAVNDDNISVKFTFPSLWE